MTDPTPPEPSPVGTTGQPWEMVIEQGKIREFAAAMQSDNPAYQGPDAIIPPTFLVTAAQWAPAGVRVNVGFERKRLLHGEQEYSFTGPPPKVGDVLVAQERIVDRYEKPGKRGGQMRFAVVLTEYRDRAGNLVAQAKATFIERAKRGASE
ncbi:FAS1-like dehydratase domain-containing protein [Gordonia hydrophobica]|uniref:FAS1-like dehydratase domain-containing protein n=1 Tax=Gordonia hydrophobica TaxID=40516 RepID=UPI000A00E611|nr:MaoC family dehydratase N-terminal domain-containing protein [Gordonia hydrophobica]MBM7368837.1 hypothetical protein [Gordonia hydrophobica]